MHGFMEQGNGKLNDASRTAAFSRMPSLFFHSTSTTRRQAAPDHLAMTRRAPRGHDHLFGGDDVFVVGAWDDVNEFGIEPGAVPRIHPGQTHRVGWHRMFPDKYPHLRDGPRSRRSRRRAPPPGKNVATSIASSPSAGCRKVIEER